MWIAAARAQGVRRRVASRLSAWPLEPGAALRTSIGVPQDLRNRDPSFWPEVASGSFGLAGAAAMVGARSPFDTEPPTAAWERHLHGFGWLRHLEAAGDPAAVLAARRLVLEWVSRGRRMRGVGELPAVRARRILSWVSQLPLLLEGATDAEFDAIGQALARDERVLAATWRTSGAGLTRLQALTALCYARLVLASRERDIERTLTLLADEIGRQILPDGGHLSRHPGVLIDLLMDWLPLRSCLEAAKVQPPDRFLIATAQMLRMLRYLKLGCGTVGRFNGMGVGDPSALATLLAYDAKPLAEWPIAPASRYARIARGDTIVLVDVGSPPPIRQSGEAHGGCLSFEMSSASALVIVNVGAPGAADGGWRSVSRATASHSTACLGETSSSQLVRHAGLEDILGAVPLQLPTRVRAEVSDVDGGARLDAVHDGYLTRLMLTHQRTLDLSADGFSLTGRDHFATPSPQDRLKRDVPFAVHFHLHPDAVCTRPHAPEAADRAALITLKDGQRWMFTAHAATLSLEESLFLAGSSGPRPSTQIVLRGACAGASEVVWALRRVTTQAD
jgi:uncharacterized heparinase superfamily protein